MGKHRASARPLADPLANAERRTFRSGVARLRGRIPECHIWSLMRIRRVGDPDEPPACEHCDREWHGLTRVILIGVTQT